jgi:hypothetical protein
MSCGLCHREARKTAQKWMRAQVVEYRILARLRRRRFPPLVASNRAITDLPGDMKARLFRKLKGCLQRRP